MSSTDKVVRLVRRMQRINNVNLKGVAITIRVIACGELNAQELYGTVLFTISRIFNLYLI